MSIRAEAEKVAADSAGRGWVADYHSDARRCSAAEVVAKLEQARVFLAAAVALPPDGSATADRRIYLAAGLAALCDGAHYMGALIDDPTDAAPQLAKIKDALMKLLAATPDGLPRGFCFLARAVLRPSQDRLVYQRRLAHLRHAQACLHAFGSVSHDAPTDRL